MLWLPVSKRISVRCDGHWCVHPSSFRYCERYRKRRHKRQWHARARTSATALSHAPSNLRRGARSSSLRKRVFVSSSQTISNLTCSSSVRRSKRQCISVAETEYNALSSVKLSALGHFKAVRRRRKAGRVIAGSAMSTAESSHSGLQGQAYSTRPKSRTGHETQRVSRPGYLCLQGIIILESSYARIFDTAQRQMYPKNEPGEVPTASLGSTAALLPTGRALWAPPRPLRALQSFRRGRAQPCLSLPSLSVTVGAARRLLSVVAWNLGPCSYKYGPP